MDKKYFETKPGSLEDVSAKIAKEQPTIKKPEPNVKLETKSYFDVKPGSLADAAAKVVSEGFIKEGTYAFDYDFTLSMPSYKVTGDGDSFKEYEGTIKATGKDAAEAKEKAEKELQKRIDAAEKSTKGSLEDPFNSILQQGKVVSEAMDPVNKDAVKKKFADRKDKDIDNDGDVDSSDKFLHKRRKAISKAMKEDLGKEDEPKVKKIIGKLKKASDAHAGQAKDLQKAMTEDDMAKFHKMQKDGKSAEQIAKALDIDVKSTKKLMDAVSPDDKGEKQNQMTHQLAKKGEKEIIKPISEKKVECPQCKGKGCDHCDNKGYHIVEKVDNPYAVGMAQAMKSTGDKPPLEKSTIKKAHDIAKAVKKEFTQLRTETKVIQLGDKGKTATGKKAAAIDVEPSAKPI